MAEAVKVCPVCGHRAMLFDDTCDCGADLGGVPPTVPGAASVGSDTSTAPGAAAVAERPAVAGDRRQGAGTGRDDRVAQPTPTQASASRSGAPDARTSPEPGGETIVLELVADPRQRFTLRSGQTIGRGRDADVCLSGFGVPDDVSRVHAVVERRPTGWYVRHVGRANFIVVDGQRYRDRDLQVALADGTVLALTATAFVVRFS